MLPDDEQGTTTTYNIPRTKAARRDHQQSNNTPRLQRLLRLTTVQIARATYFELL